ncbi:hypothetical protein AYO44_07150 [Planctomycetaceae bacterium SCGC AG-212-F19]|nr:hypothetical protein AYO44_07150 [Planctomycetaceae bacterium SCGC AG-212-F19]
MNLDTCTRRAFLRGSLLTAGGVALGSSSLGAPDAPTSRQLAIAIDKALAANPKAYPRELVEQCTAAAIAEFQGCKPDPAVVQQLAALPDNTWLEMNAAEAKGTPDNHHSFPRYRGEGSATYDAAARAVVCFAGCGAPNYSCDLWAYKTGANRWFEIWPNIPRPIWMALPERPKDRPPPGCTLGLGYAADTGSVYRFTCANTGDEGRNVWETRLLSGKWQVVGREQQAGVPAEGIRIAADPVLGGLLSVSPVGTRLFSFRTKDWTTIPGDGPKMGVCAALTYLTKAECALCVGAPGNRPGGNAEKDLPEVETWLFHSKRQQWERVKTTPRPEWYYRGGITYDSLNNVALFGGWKSSDAGSGPDVTPGLWVFDPTKKEWHYEKPASGPKGRFEYFAYDPEYNVAVTAGNGHGTWLYRYCRAKG